MTERLIERPRRLRRTEALRELVRETRLAPSDFICPIFVRAEGERRPIPSLPGHAQLPVAEVPAKARELWSLGIRAVILFGIPARKDPYGSENKDPDGVVPRALRAMKDAVPEMVAVSDMCFCEYTDHGHCGIVNRRGDPHYDPHLPEGYLLNDPTLELLAQASVVHAEAGADVIAPSGMVDGMVAAIRRGLDEAGFAHTVVMSYATKFASHFYGPFRDAAESPPRFGDRRGYQMDPANRREALREALLDAREGADILMVKPALPYLDVILEVRRHTRLPVAAYQVSGEYAMLRAAADRGWVPLPDAALETLVAIRRAGADLILTYFAEEAARWLLS